MDVAARPKGGPGAIADFGSHIIAMARYLLGPIAEVNADVRTIVPSRPVARGAKERRDVLVDDAARMLVQFGRGCAGTIEASWVSTGRKMQLDFEVYGTKGSLVFTQERMNEMLLYKAAGETMAHGADSRTNGFVRVESGPQHYPYGQFCLAGSHHIGFNDLKTMEWRSSSPASARAKRMARISARPMRCRRLSTRRLHRRRPGAGCGFRTVFRPNLPSSPRRRGTPAFLCQQCREIWLELKVLSRFARGLMQSEAGSPPARG